MTKTAIAARRRYRAKKAALGPKKKKPRRKKGAGISGKTQAKKMLSDSLAKWKVKHNWKPNQKRVFRKGGTRKKPTGAGVDDWRYRTMSGIRKQKPRRQMGRAKPKAYGSGGLRRKNGKPKRKAKRGRGVPVGAGFWEDVGNFFTHTLPETVLPVVAPLLMAL